MQTRKLRPCEACDPQTPSTSATRCTWFKSHGSVANSKSCQSCCFVPELPWSSVQTVSCLGLDPCLWQIAQSPFCASDLGAPFALDHLPLLGVPSAKIQGQLNRGTRLQTTCCSFLIPSLEFSPSLFHYWLEPQPWQPWACHKCPGDKRQLSLIHLARVSMRSAVCALGRSVSEAKTPVLRSWLPSVGGPPPRAEQMSTWFRL